MSELNLSLSLPQRAISHPVCQSQCIIDVLDHGGWQTLITILK